MELTTTKEKILEAAIKCSTAKRTLEILFPEAFERPGPKFKIGDRVVSDRGPIRESGGTISGVSWQTHSGSTGVWRYEMEGCSGHAWEEEWLRPEPVYEWQWLLKRPTGKYDVTNNYYTCHYEMQKANGLSSDFWRIEGSKRERTA